jgi:hypothetical protein
MSNDGERGELERARILAEFYASSTTSSHTRRLRQAALARLLRERRGLTSQEWNERQWNNHRPLPDGARRGTERTFWHLFGPGCNGSGAECPARFGPHSPACRQRSSRSR